MSNYEYLGIRKGKFCTYCFRNAYGSEAIANIIWYYLKNGYKKVSAKPGEIVFAKDDREIVIWAYDYN